MAMADELKEAAVGGHVVFLRGAAAEGKPPEYFKAVSQGDGNMLHIAAKHGKTRFVSVAMEILPTPLVHFLLCQPEVTCHGRTPLGVAAYEGNNRVVMEMLNFYDQNWPSSSSSSSYSLSVKPWSVEDQRGNTGFNLILRHCSEECGLKLLSIDPKLCDAIVKEELPSNPLIIALNRGHGKVALEFFNSSRGSVFSNKRILANALLEAPKCSEEIFKLVLQKNVEFFIRYQTYANLYVYYKDLLVLWITVAKLFPFKCVLEGDPHLRAVIFHQMDYIYVFHYVIGLLGDDMAVEISKPLVDAYIQEKGQPKWLTVKYEEKTCLRRAIEKGYTRLALYILSMRDAMLLLENDETILLDAIKEDCGGIALRIVELVDEYGLETLLVCPRTGGNALHFAPLCQDESLLTRLLEKFPELLWKEHKDRKTVLHEWIKCGKLWPFECLQEKELLSITRKNMAVHDEIYERCSAGRKTALRYVAYRFMDRDNEEKTPLHYLAEHRNKEFALEAFRHIFRVIKKGYPVLKELFFVFDKEGFSPFTRALSIRREKLAACFISKASEVTVISTLTWPLERVGALLYKAAEYNCNKVLQDVFDKLCQHELIQTSNVRNMLTFDDRLLLEFHRSDVPRPETGHRITLLHIAHKCTEAQSKFLIETFPKLINKKDRYGKTPLDRASEAGASRVVELMLKQDHSSILKAPRAWIRACQSSHFSTILAFIDHSPYLRYLCREQRDTPLHNIKGLNYSEYHELLHRPLMKELKNTLNKDGKTPLHKAIENRDMDFAEILLQTSDIDRAIKDRNGRTPMDLLKLACQESDDWKEVRRRSEVDAFIRPDTDLTEMRNIISIVAALLATITFTVGFQLPGGTDGGEAKLATKAAFLMFLISNVYAMCTAMLVLFCIIWSMVCYKSESVKLINRSLVLLKQSLYGTLLAFMSGVYVVIHHKILWAAIVIFFMCSFVILSAGKSILDRLLSYLPPAEDDQLTRLLIYLKGAFDKKKDDDDMV